MRTPQETHQAFIHTPAAYDCKEVKTQWGKLSSGQGNIQWIKSLTSFPQTGNPEAILQGFSEGLSRVKPQSPAVVRSSALHPLLAFPLLRFTLPNAPVLFLEITSQNKLPQDKHLSQTTFCCWIRLRNKWPWKADPHNEILELDRPQNTLRWRPHHCSTR